MPMLVVLFSGHLVFVLFAVVGVFSFVSAGYFALFIRLAGKIWQLD